MTNAIAAPGPDRLILNNNAREALYAVGLASGVSGISWSKADALAKAVGGNIDSFTPTLTVLGKTFSVIGTSIGVVGVVTGLPSLYIGITDGDMSNEDWRNVAQLGLGVAGIFVTGWVAVGLGVVSVGIAIYDRP